MSDYTDPYWVYGSADDKIEFVPLSELKVDDFIWYNHAWHKVIRMNPEMRDGVPWYTEVSFDEIKIINRRTTSSFDVGPKDHATYFVRKVK